MSTQAKKRKVDGECRTFKATWTNQFFFTEVKGKPVCLICGRDVSVLKEYNLSRHYETLHADRYKHFTDAERARAAQDLLAKLGKQQGCFTKLHAAKDAATRTSFVISHKIAQNSKPFSEGEFVKECMVESAALICPEKKEAFEQVRMNECNSVQFKHNSVHDYVTVIQQQ